MSDKAQKTAIVERHRYVLDWFEIDKMELSLENTCYEFQYRFGGDWYLEARAYDKNAEEWRDVHWRNGGAFNLASPGAALAALDGCVTKFTAISSGIGFEKALAALLSKAHQLKGQP